MDPRLSAAPRVRPPVQEGHNPFLEPRDVEKVLQQKAHGMARRADRRLRRRRGSDASVLSSASEARDAGGLDGDDDDGADVPATGSGIRAVRAARSLRSTAGPVSAAAAGPRDRVAAEPGTEGHPSPLRTTVAAARVPKPPLAPAPRRSRSATPSRVAQSAPGEGGARAAGPEIASAQRVSDLGADAPRRVQSAMAATVTGPPGQGSDQSGDDAPCSEPEADRARQRDAFLERQTEHLHQLAARRRAQKEAQEEERQREQRRLVALRSQANAMRRAHVEKREEQRRVEAAAKKKVKVCCSIPYVSLSLFSPPGGVSVRACVVLC